MAHYAIGDVQGCYRELMALMDKIAFNEQNDTLWFAGDIMNGGPDNRNVLRFISHLPSKTIVTLGNHDLHFLAVYYGIREYQSDDTFHDVLNAPDVDELVHWLCQKKLLHYDNQLNYLMSHAGIYPIWSLTEALGYAQEIESYLNSHDPSIIKSFLLAIFGVQDDEVSRRLRNNIDILTRMRFCYSGGRLNLGYKGTIQEAPAALIPWFQCLGDSGHSSLKDINILFGHWAALEGKTEPYKQFYALDTGCVWGGALSALCLETKQWFQVKSQKHR